MVMHSKISEIRCRVIQQDKPWNSTDHGSPEEKKDIKHSHMGASSSRTTSVRHVIKLRYDRADVLPNEIVLFARIPVSQPMLNDRIQSVLHLIICSASPRWMFRQNGMGCSTPWILTCIHTWTPALEKRVRRRHGYFQREMTPSGTDGVMCA